MVVVVMSLPNWVVVLAVIGLVAAMAYILLSYWKGRR
jgi:hypothetical protein